MPQEKGSAPKLSFWPCFSLLLSPPRRKSSWIYKKLKNTDKGVNRKQHLKVSGGWGSGRDGSMGQVLCRAVAQPWGRLEVCAVGGGADGGSRVPQAPKALVFLPPWPHLTGVLASSEDPEDRPLVRAGAGAGSAAGVGPVTEQGRPLPGSSETVILGCGPARWAGSREHKTGFSFVHPTCLCEGSHADSQETLRPKGTLGGRELS